MRGSKASRKQQFVNITSGKEVSGPSICKKMGIRMGHMHQLICNLRSEGHEIWVISKGGRDETAFYQHKGGPEIRMTTRDKMIEMLKRDHYSVEFMAQSIFVETCTIRSALAKIRKQYKLDIVRSGYNRNHYKIVGELNG